MHFAAFKRLGLVPRECRGHLAAKWMRACPALPSATGQTLPGGYWTTGLFTGFFFFNSCDLEILYYVYWLLVLWLLLLKMFKEHSHVCSSTAFWRKGVLIL